jgi:putative Ca2+/H+ antiporter (TMEM165/GDT1 family)
MSISKGFHGADFRPLKNLSPVGPATLLTLVVGLVEIGDETQIATVGLASRFEEFYQVAVGTTLGMMLANIPAVLTRNKIADRSQVDLASVPPYDRNPSYRHISVQIRDCS